MKQLIDISELATALQHQSGQIWDVRDAQSYQEGHIAQAINQPLADLTPQLLDNIANDEPIYILCGGGTKAGKAIDVLESFDSSRTYIELKGGTRGAKALGLDIISE